RAEAARDRQIARGDDLFLTRLYALAGRRFFRAWILDAAVRLVGRLALGARADLFGQNVARDLFADELIVWFIFVERFDHVVAVTVGRDHRIIRIVAGRVRIAHDVEPIPAPFFAVSLTAEQTINDLLEGVRRRVL